MPTDIIHRIISFKLKTVEDVSGNLSIVESIKDLPFEIKRIYYIWNTIKNLPRGSHAHKHLKQAFIAIHGSCSLSFNDGFKTEYYLMNDPSVCLYVPPGFWRDIQDFSTDCVLLVLASEHYDESDYIRDYDEFLEYVKNDK